MSAARPTPRHRVLVALATIAALVLGAVVAAGPARAAAAPAATGPALTVPAPQLRAATHCDSGAAAGRRTVLLIPGTGATDAEAWAWNYELALPAAGYGVCTVTLPNRSLSDFSISAQYAVYAARTAYRLSGQPIGILGHSQGGLMAVWIAKFWPDVARHASDVIGLAADVRGTQLANTLCVAGSCSLIAWQMRRGSHLTNAATRAPLPTTTSFTSIATQTDEVVFPQPQVSTFPGTKAILLQSICPGRVVDHGLLLADAVAYALVLDALRRPGPARPAAIDRATCSQVTMPHVDPVGSVAFAKTLVALSVGLLDATHYITAEPALPTYARRYG